MEIEEEFKELFLQIDKAANELVKELENSKFLLYNKKSKNYFRINDYYKALNCQDENKDLVLYKKIREY